MSSLLTTLGIDRLSPEDRLQLIEEIWESLGADGSGLPVSEAQKSDLDRRAAELDADPGVAIARDEARARALARQGNRLGGDDLSVRGQGIPLWMTPKTL